MCWFLTTSPGPEPQTPSCETSTSWSHSTSSKLVFFSPRNFPAQPRSLPRYPQLTCSLPSTASPEAQPGMDPRQCPWQSAVDSGLSPHSPSPSEGHSSSWGAEEGVSSSLAPGLGLHMACQYGGQCLPVSPVPVCKKFFPTAGRPSVPVPLPTTRLLVWGLPRLLLLPQ